MELIENLGIIVAAFSGSFIGIQKKLDLFGIMLIAMVTGVGGGVLRDVLINRTPIILRREIYAVPAIIGALIYVYIRPYMIGDYALWICATIIATIRIIAVRRDLHMPHIKRREER